MAVVIILASIGNKNNRDLAQEASADTNEGSYEISDEDMYNAEDIFTDTEGSTEMSGDEQGVQTGEDVENPGGQHLPAAV